MRRKTKPRSRASWSSAMTAPCAGCGASRLISSWWSSSPSLPEPSSSPWCHHLLIREIAVYRRSPPAVAGTRGLIMNFAGGRAPGAPHAWGKVSIPTFSLLSSWPSSSQLSSSPALVSTPFRSPRSLSGLIWIPLEVRRSATTSENTFREVWRSPVRTTLLHP